MKYLLVEDNPELAKAICSRMELDGHQVDHANKISDAVAFAQTGEYDLILLDIMLPDGDGRSFLKQHRAAKNDTPVIVLTARSQVSDRISMLDLGADVPMCLLPRPLRAQGIGEKIEFLDLPALPAVFVNPRVPVSTPEVFRALKSKTNPPMPDRLPDFASTVDLIDFLAGCRNDLEPVARTLVPEIGLTLDALSACDGCELSRMSGSGATCFGIFSSVDSGKAAVDRLRHLYPDYWIAGGLVGDKLQRSMPVRK